MFAVNINLAIANHQHITRQSDTTFHIIFTMVYWTINYLTVLFGSTKNRITTCRIIKLIYLTLFKRRHTLCADNRRTTLLSYLTTYFVSQRRKAFFLNVERHAITRRIIEHNDVIVFHLTETGHTL